MLKVCLPERHEAGEEFPAVTDEEDVAQQIRKFILKLDVASLSLRAHWDMQGALDNMAAHLDVVLDEEGRDVLPARCDEELLDPPRHGEEPLFVQLS